MEYNKIFIGGCPRSGTGWVGSIFRHHPQVITIHESFAYRIFLRPFIDNKLNSFRGRWKYYPHAKYKIYNIIPIIKGYSDNDKWRYLTNLHKMYPNINLFKYVSPDQLCEFINEARRHGELTNVEKAEYIIKLIFDNLFISSGGTKNHILVEKTPNNIAFADRILTKYPEAKIIEAVRDGRDVCLALEMYRRWWSPKNRSGQIKLWVKSIEEGMKFKYKSDFSDRIYTIKYEDLKENFEDQIRALFRFAHIDDSDEIVFKIKEQSFRAKEVNKTYKNGLIYERGVTGQWKKFLTTEDIKTIKRIAGDTLEKLGYTW